MKIFLKTYGCQMNVRDSELVCGLLQKNGYQIIQNLQKADVVLFNTCSVRQHAEDRVFSEIGKLKILKEKNPNLIIGVIGCMAQNHRDKIFKRASVVDLVCGPNDIDSIPLLIKKARSGHADNISANKAKREESVYNTRYNFDKNHSFVVISEGCNNFCSYCVVPFVRGRERSRDFNDVLSEIKSLVKKGIKDITLLGQNVNSYNAGVSFIELLKKVNEIKGLISFTFFTSHPKDVTRDLFIAMHDLKKLKKLLHLPIQSGSDRILKLMNRGYSVKHYKEIVGLYRKIVPNGNISTDVIVGFPTETKRDFQKSLNLFKEIKFDAAYIFKYSPRPHTKAAQLVDDVPRIEKERRHKIILDLQREMGK
ncbi:MAG: tRNA (N6-isopentenyl adenosine(37)-C2)-methylthiotransferase MiaB [Candidatus Omnitrophota bacterium]